MMKSIVVGSIMLVGSAFLAGCGLSGNVTATPTGNGNYNISGTVHTNSTPNSATQSATPSTASSHASNPSSPTVSSSSPTSSTASQAENTLPYTSQEKSFIIQAAQSIGLPSVDVPMHGFGSQFQYTQRILMSGGGSMLVIQYNNFGIQEFTRPMLTGRAVLRTVPLTILGSSVTGTWNQPAPASGGGPSLTFHINGMYYLIGGSRALSQTQIDTIAESLAKL